MGFDAKPTIYRLEFDDPDLAGLVVRVRRGSVRDRFDYDNAENWQDQLEVFARVLVEWNLELDGEPVPMTVDGLWSVEDKVVDTVLDAWVRAGRAPAPLEQPSTSGDEKSLSEADLAVAASLPMASLAS